MLHPCPRASQRQAVKRRAAAAAGRLACGCRAMVLLLAGLALASCRFPIQVTIDSARAPIAEASSPDHVVEATVTPHLRPTHAPTRVPQTGVEPTRLPTPQIAQASPTPACVSPAKTLPTRIVAPAIGLDAPVVEIGWITNPEKQMTEWQTADDAVGFHRGSALPGWRGNTVLSGHHNIKGKVFQNLWKLKAGDVVEVYTSDAVYHYLVEDAFIIPERDVADEQRQQNARWIAPTSDERLTLITCWPANDNTHRVIVIARRVPCGLEETKP
jgi:LPXTG-site transpeptidase (sortase) family protein